MDPSFGISDAGPFVAAHTPALPEWLSRLSVSLLVTTYQAGKLVIVRSDGTGLNTHFRTLPSPMGLALTADGQHLAIGTRTEIRTFQNVPDVARRLEPAGTHDAGYVPRSTHTTGNIQIHEMAYGADRRLWFVNTRFSCLATADSESSFVPHWRPRFISRLEPTDRCHLNGLAMRDGRPQFVTALGESDETAGWRANKARGGVLLDVDSGETICRGLSMPHSPRWHRGHIWLCESGSGSLGIVHPDTGRYEPVVRLPGFPRGLDFAADFAFVGLSQVRESAVFSGLPLTEQTRPEDRLCGVCVVDLRRGEPVAILSFRSGVREIFAVAVLPRRFPDVITDDQSLIENSFVVPSAALDNVAEPFRVISSK